MTTVIVVAIVALVFFVTVCVITFMVWKRETEMRTDSLKGIETSLNEVLRELSAENTSTYGRRGFYAGSNDDFYEGYNRSTIRARKGTDNRKKKNGKDPFSWVRSDNSEDFNNEELKVFRPDETQTRKVKWTEVPAPEAADELTPAAAEAPPADDVEKNQEEIAAPPEADSKAASETATEPADDKMPKSTPEINLSFIDLEEIDNIDLDGIDFGGPDFFENPNNVPADYNTGRSGKKYTAEELESLIKE